MYTPRNNMYSSNLLERKFKIGQLYFKLDRLKKESAKKVAKMDNSEFSDEMRAAMEAAYFNTPEISSLTERIEKLLRGSTSMFGNPEDPVIHMFDSPMLRNQQSAGTSTGLEVFDPYEDDKLYYPMRDREDRANYSA
tara:strand:+ start:189 stop:599 length:411 start_codon:yes stop_codon:yes gene_type:complete